MQICNFINLQLEKSSSNRIHVLCRRATFARGVVMGLVANNIFDGDVQALFVLLPK